MLLLLLRLPKGGCGWIETRGGGYRRRKWTLTRPTAYLGLRCFSCESGGTNGHNGDWTWARLPCRVEGEPPLAGLNATGTARHCPITPRHFFT